MGLAALLLWLVFRGTDWDRAWEAVRSARPLLLLLSLAAILVSTALRAARWRVLLSPLDSALPYAFIWRHYNIGLGISSLVPGRVGELTRSYLVSRARRIPFAGVLATVVCEFTIDLVVVLGLFGWMFVYPAVLGVGGEGGGSGRARALLEPAALVFGLLALLVAPTLLVLATRSHRALAVAERVLGTLPAALSARILGELRSFAAGVAGLGDRRRIRALLGSTAAAWAAVVLSCQACLAAFGLHVPLGHAAWLTAVATLGMAAPTPGGLGSYHAVVVLVVGGLWGLGGEQGDTVAAYALVSHLIQHLPATVLGAWYAFREGASPWGVAREVRREAEPMDPSNCAWHDGDQR